MENKMIFNNVFDISNDSFTNQFVQNSQETMANDFYFDRHSMKIGDSNAMFFTRTVNESAFEPKGKYSIEDIANWFLKKEKMEHIKLQIMCYYAQAWNYTINDYRLIDSDFQAWEIGPVSQSLWTNYEHILENFENNIKKEVLFDGKDLSLLEEVYNTYGDKTSNALALLSQREEPWQEARKGYTQNEKSRKAINPDTIKKYYFSIYNK